MGLAASLAGACTASVNVDQERSTLLSRDREWSGTTKDVDKFISYLAADASVYPPGSPVVTGTDAIRKMFTEMSSAPGFSLEWTPSRADVSASGDLGYTTGTYHGTTQAGTETGKYVTAWKKIGGEWKATEDIFNANGPEVPKHAMVAPDTLKWGDAPPGLPPGAKFAVVSGDPAKAQPFVIRVQAPAGYRIAPHWHPTTENLTVLSGTVALGMGDKVEEQSMTNLNAGGYVVMPAEMRHSFLARTVATVQVHGVGPFAITYVNVADDPRQRK
jgi:ketosteroid isomerase-like protein/quercetin dioxygenase-like cupin family protein